MIPARKRDDIPMTYRADHTRTATLTVGVLATLVGILLAIGIGTIA